jgi:hypothetical protein
MTYIEILEKIQAQALSNLKEIQAAQISTLRTVREVVASLPSLMSSQNVEGMPTLSQVVELTTSFATGLLDQEKAFVNQLTEVVSPAAKSAITV